MSCSSISAQGVFPVWTQALIHDYGCMRRSAFTQQMHYQSVIKRALQDLLLSRSPVNLESFTKKVLKHTDGMVNPERLKAELLFRLHHACPQSSSQSLLEELEATRVQWQRNFTRRLTLPERDKEAPLRQLAMASEEHPARIECRPRDLGEEELSDEELQLSGILVSLKSSSLGKRPVEEPDPCHSHAKRLKKLEREVAEVCAFHDWWGISRFECDLMACNGKPLTRRRAC